MQSVEIIADSVNTFGQRITTVKATFWRALLAELNTHRMLTRNSASSRAIRFEKMVESVMNNPFIPMAWQKDHSGMQGTEYFTQDEVVDLNLVEDHLIARDYAVEAATRQSKKGVTKQLCNRYLEPFMYHTALITGTELENFFALRAPQYSPYQDNSKIYGSRKDMIKDFSNMSDATDVDWLYLNDGTAEIHFMDLAEKFLDAMNASTPKQLQPGEWHIPFGDQFDQVELSNLAAKVTIGEHVTNLTLDMLAVKLATVRCARISYVVPGSERKINYAADLELHDRLAAAGHMSAFEHCAKAMSSEEYHGPLHWAWGEPGWCKNFRGFIQYRAMFPNENRSDSRLIKK